MTGRNTAETGEAARRLARDGRWCRPTASLAPGYVQTNLLVVPGEAADEFEDLCAANPRPLPLLERLPLGSSIPRRIAVGADLRTDLPLYRVFRNGTFIGERTDLLDVWPDDGCAFLLGCSFTFDSVLSDAGIPIRHREADRNVPMYRTHRPLVPAGRFGGTTVVSLRPVPARFVSLACALTEPLTQAHGGPLNVGEPLALGIADLSRPDYGDPPDVHPGDVPLFWACGVTAQQTAVAAQLRYTLTHAPGHMFVTDLRITETRAGA